MRLDVATTIHADSPFNKLKAALNCDSHVVDERANAPVSLTSRTLSYLIEHPSTLSKFIQDQFMWTDGSRISEGHAKSFAMDVCVQFRTCAVALLAVPRCTQRPRLIGVAVQSWPFRIVFGFLAEPSGMVVLLAVGLSMLTGAHEHRCAMALGQLWTLRRVRWPRVSVHRPPPPRGPAAHPNFARGTVQQVAGTPALPRPPCKEVVHPPWPSPRAFTTVHVLAVVFLSIAARPFPWFGTARVLQLPQQRTMVQLPSLLLKCFVDDSLRSHVCCALAPFQARSRLR